MLSFITLELKTDTIMKKIAVLTKSKKYITFYFLLIITCSRIIVLLGETSGEIEILTISTTLLTILLH